MSPRTEAPATVVVRLSDADRATVTGIMARLRAAWGRQVEPYEAVLATLREAAPQAA